MKRKIKVRGQGENDEWDQNKVRGDQERRRERRTVKKKMGDGETRKKNKGSRDKGK